MEDITMNSINRRKAKRISICLVVAMVLLVACNNNETQDNLEGNKGKNVEVSDNQKVLLQKLITTKATSKINFVGTKYDKFWQAIDNNFIDTEYNKTCIEKGNIRLWIKANKNYASKWIKELDETYTVLSDILQKDDREKLEKQYNEFKEYYDNTEKIYTFILDVDDEYEGKVDGNYKIRQYFALADEAREYTILLKEYIYLLKNKVEFYTMEEDSKVSDNKVEKYKKNTPDINFAITTDVKAKDIIMDTYSKKAKCSIKKLNEEKARKKVANYYKYWQKEVKSNFDNLEKELKGEHKDILKKQEEAYNKFLSQTTKVNSMVLKGSKIYKKLYKEDVVVENVMYKGKETMNYNILLVEYYYAIKGKVSL